MEKQSKGLAELAQGCYEVFMDSTQNTTHRIAWNDLPQLYKDAWMRVVDFVFGAM